MTMAFYIAALPNQKKAVKLEELLVPLDSGPKAPRRQTMEEQIAIARQWSAATAH